MPVRLKLRLQLGGRMRKAFHRRPAVQDLTRDVVRIDAIPSTSLDTIRVRRSAHVSAQLTALRGHCLASSQHSHYMLACALSSLGYSFLGSAVRPRACACEARHGCESCGGCSVCLCSASFQRSRLPPMLRRSGWAPST